MAMTEDTLVQQTTAGYLLNNLHWDDSVYGMNEVLDKEDTLGRDSEKEVVLSRYLGEALMRLNPGLPAEAYRDAVRQRIYDYLYDDKTGLPVERYAEDEIEGLTEALFNHVYRAYPALPSPIL